MANWNYEGEKAIIDTVNAGAWNSYDNTQKQSTSGRQNKLAIWQEVFSYRKRKVHMSTASLNIRKNDKIQHHNTQSQLPGILATLTAIA
ncbi:MAG: hypothetical protein AMJ60_00640 [Desulfobacterales bacterium SG8_35]|nr:MAG: hypothetical protein AMJ60_00640 [Desulfobacterales bacterium SG8_35]